MPFGKYASRCIFRQRSGILLHPAIGAVLMSLSTVVVAVNAQLLRRVDLTVG